MPSETVPGDSRLPTRQADIHDSLKTNAVSGWSGCFAATSPCRRTAQICLSLAALALLVYLPALSCDFVNWDDPWYVIHNPLIRSWHPGNLYRIATETVVRNFAPLTVLSLLIDHTFWGLNPAGYHFTNILLHAGNVVLAFLLIRQITGNTWTATATAALLAVHPVHVESVAWISSRKGLLSGVFLLASLRYWLRRERRPVDELHGTWLLGLALLAKAIAVVVPAIVLCWDVLVCRRKPGEALARQFVPGLLCVWLLLVTMSAQVSETGGFRHHLELGRLQLLAIDTTILWRYVGLLVWPATLKVLYDVPTRDIWHLVLAATAGWCLVGWLAWHVRHRAPLVPFALLTSLLLLVPVLNLFPITTLMNERYLYLPSIPLFALAAAGMAQGTAWLVHRLSASKQRSPGGTPRAWPFSRDTGGAPWLPVGATVLVLVAVGACSWKTRQQLTVWRNGTSLWLHTRKHVPTLPVVHIQWANTLASLGRNEEAVAVLRHTLQTLDVDEVDTTRIRRKLREWRAGRATSHPAGPQTGGTQRSAPWRNSRTSASFPPSGTPVETTVRTPFPTRAAALPAP